MFSENVSDFDDPVEHWPTDGDVDLFSSTKDLTLCSKTDLWTNYDKSIGGRTIELGRGTKYTILDLHEVNKKLIITWGQDFHTCYDNIISKDGKPVGLVNCLIMVIKRLNKKYVFFKKLTAKCVKYDVPVLKKLSNRR